MKQLQDKTYRLADNRSGESFIPKTGRNGRLTIFDEETNTRRAIRHCPNQPSIFIDEQDKFARVSPVLFTSGYLTVSGKDPITQQFLDAHPSNVANGGKWFEFIDEEKEAKESIEIDELQIDLKYAVRQTAKKKDGIHKLKAEVAVITGSIDRASRKGIEELKQELYNHIESNPYYFTDDLGNPNIFDNEEILRKYMVLKALQDGVIRKSANSKTMMWAKGKEKIYSAPIGVELVEAFSEYLTTDEGMLVLEEITRRS